MWKQLLIRKIRGLKIEPDPGMMNFEAQFSQFKQISAEAGERFKNVSVKPYLNDNSQQTLFDAHYVYHPAWAARILNKIRPSKHIDISSTLHFCSIVSAFLPVEFYDYRPAQLTLSQLHCGHADLTQLHFATNSIESLSCMHTVEHVGLGRYGDPIDPEGDLKAIAELKRVLLPGGSLLFVVPVGQPTLVFNAHRIYSYEMILDYFQEFECLDFSLVTDSHGFISPSNQTVSNQQQYGCGCFWFKKRHLDHC